MYESFSEYYGSQLSMIVIVSEGAKRIGGNAAGVKYIFSCVSLRKHIHSELCMISRLQTMFFKDIDNY